MTVASLINISKFSFTKKMAENCPKTGGCKRASGALSEVINSPNWDGDGDASIMDYPLVMTVTLSY